MRIWTKKIVHVETLSDLVGFRRLAAPSFDRQVDHPRYLHGDMGRKVLCSIDFSTNGDLRDAEVYGEIYGAKIIDVHSLLAMKSSKASGASAATCTILYLICSRKKGMNK